MSQFIVTCLTSSNLPYFAVLYPPVYLTTCPTVSHCLTLHALLSGSLKSALKPASAPPSADSVFATAAAAATAALHTATATSATAAAQASPPAFSSLPLTETLSRGDSAMQNYARCNDKNITTSMARSVPYWHRHTASDDTIYVVDTQDVIRDVASAAVASMAVADTSRTQLAGSASAAHADNMISAFTNQACLEGVDSRGPQDDMTSSPLASSELQSEDSRISLKKSVRFATPERVYLDEVCSEFLRTSFKRDQKFRLSQLNKVRGKYSIGGCIQWWCYLVSGWFTTLVSILLGENATKYGLFQGPMCQNAVAEWLHSGDVFEALPACDLRRLVGFKVPAAPWWVSVKPGKGIAAIMQRETCKTADKTD